MRKTILSLAGILILAIGFFGFKMLSNNKKNPTRVDKKFTTSIYVEIVVNKNIPISIATSGSITAKDRMVIFSEVQGVFMPSSKAYKTGVKYQKGEAMIRINKEEFNASVIAKRSSFVNLLTAILPDIQFDYPTSLTTWKQYLKSINIKQNLPALPIISSEKERNFITGKTIYSTFYSIKNMETRLKKYTITAPYQGVLVEANITPGTLVNPGQKLGEYIKPGVYELELNVNANLQNLLEKGKLVELYNIEKTKHWEGIVSRVNGKIDRSSQTIKIYVEVKANDLKEGEYLVADIYAKEATNAIEIPRSLLVNNKSIYVLDGEVLKLVEVELIYSNLNSIVITGLTDGMEYLSKTVAGAYPGMEVKVITK